MPAPLWKDSGPSQKVRRAMRTKTRKSHLDASKRVVKARDKGCRFPLCGCRRLRLRLEVSHRAHQGAGGNPAEDRNDAANLLLVCAERHKDNPISLDRHTLQWEPLTADGAKGPIVWFLDIAMYAYLTGQATQRPVGPTWFEVAAERQAGTVGPLSPRQTAVLQQLALMEI